jgi:hypothetical protein
MLFDADELVKMATNSEPLQSGRFQPFVDEMSRYFNAAGIDLKNFGINANKITDINMLKKVLGDMTFSQIAQYHLGRWTNYEVGLLKQKLPSIDTDPSSLIRIALLFKNASQRELDSYAQENKIAFGENGENMFAPKDLGKAKMYGVNSVASQEGLVPWAQFGDLNSPTTSETAAYTKLPPGSFYEDKRTGQMHRKP